MVNVSIVIVNYNTFDFTLQCVKSVCEKTRGVSIEIIIVDNASKFFNDEAFSFVTCNLSIVKNEKNLGFAKANNIGIKASQGEIILLLNNDTELINDAISLSYNQLVSADNIGVVGCMLRNPDYSWQQSFFPYPTIPVLLKRLFRFKIPALDSNKSSIVDWVSGAFFMFRRKDLSNFTNSVLNEDYFMYCEDIKWCKDFKRSNLYVLYYPEGELFHFKGKSSTIDDDFSKRIKFYFPNLRHFLSNEYGFLYSRLYFLILFLLYATDSKRNSLKKTLWPLLKVAFRGY